MKFLRYFITFPWDVLVIPLVLVIHLLWGENLRMEGLVVCTDLKADSWPRRTWYAKWGGTTFGHAIMYRPSPREKTKVHEHVHVHQFEASMLKSMLVGLLVLPVTGKLWLSYAIWALGFSLYLAANWATAVLRGGEAYRGSVHEEHAYAVGDLWDEQHNDAYRRRLSRT